MYMRQHRHPSQYNMRQQITGNTYSKRNEYIYLHAPPFLGKRPIPKNRHANMGDINNATAIITQL